MQTSADLCQQEVAATLLEFDQQKQIVRDLIRRDLRIDDRRPEWQRRQRKLAHHS